MHKSYIKILLFTLLFIDSNALLADDKKMSSDFFNSSVLESEKLFPVPSGYGGQLSSFGRSMDVLGNRMVIGSPGINEASGVAMVYENNGKEWLKVAVLKPSDFTQNKFFGSSVNLYGNRILIGAPYDGGIRSRSGSAYIFEFDGENWKQEAKLIPNDGYLSGYFGTSVSIFEDMALIGAPGAWENGVTTGAAYLFRFNGSKWLQEQKIVANDASSLDYFGTEVTLQNNRIVISATGTDKPGDSSGSAYVFDFNGQHWVQSKKLLAHDGLIGGLFGCSLSLNGTSLIVGACLDDDNGLNSGSAYLFKLIENQWTFVQKLVSSDGYEDGYFGQSAILTENKIFIGAPGNPDNLDNIGVAYVFEFNGAQWSESNRLISPAKVNYDRFGYATGFGNGQFIVGAFGDTEYGLETGAAYAYEFDGIDWQQKTKLLPDETSAYDLFGISVSISGSRALIGSYRDDDNGLSSGSSYIFEFDGIRWIRMAKLNANDAEKGDVFGYSVSIDGDRALVGAFLEDEGAVNSGAVYVFNYDGENWAQDAKLKPSVANEDDWFGSAVSLSGDWALIGAENDDDMGEDAGAAYLFKFNGNNWHQYAKLTGGDITQADKFANSVSLQGGRALIGSKNSNGNSAGSGAAYIFDFDGLNWIESAKLNSDDGSVGDQFGFSVSLSHNRALIGSHQTDTEFYSSTGSAYIFDYDGSSWSQSIKLTTGDAYSGDRFGYSVSLRENRALIGAPYEDDRGGDSGSAYIFEYDGNQWNERTKLNLGDGDPNDRFGYSVSLSESEALISAYRDDDSGTDSGSVCVIGASTLSGLCGDLIYDDGFDELSVMH